MREFDWLMVGGAVLFGAGAGVVLIAIGEASDRLALVGVVGMLGAAVCLRAGARRAHARAVWLRLEAEQRLWESGPLGRTWLRIRKSLLGR